MRPRRSRRAQGLPTAEEEQAARRFKDRLRARAAAAAGVAPKDWRDWAGGLPDEVLEKVAGKLVEQTEAGWTAQLKAWDGSEEEIQEEMVMRKRDGNCPLFVFAKVCKGWRAAQLKVGGLLRTRVGSDVLLPGRVALVKWALAEGCPREMMGSILPFSMAHGAAQFGHLELVRWLIQEQGFAMDKGVMAMAARGGNLELVRWLRGEGCPWDAETCKWAVFGGHLETLRWARENGCDWSEETCRDAAEYGHKELVRWLIQEQGFAMDRNVMSHAASSGNLELVKWLRSEGCPWDAWTCRRAAQNGHLETLRWARENGCEWDAYCRERAAEELGYTDDHGNLIQ